MSVRRRRNIWDVVVVGGGIAGLTAAWYAARRGLATALFEAQPNCGGQVATINVLDDWPSVGESSGVELAAALVNKLDGQAVEILYQPVRGVAPGKCLAVVEAGGSTLRARRVIAATGARLRTLQVPQEESLRGKGVSQCAHCDGYFFRGQDVVVVGGGDAALQEALVLASGCRAVTIVARSKLRAKQGYVERAAAAANMRFIWDSVVDVILGSGAVSGVRLRNVKNGEVTDLACAGVFPFIGVEPNSAFLPPSVRRDESGRVLTDDSQRTTEPLVFAIGAVRAGYSGELVSAVGEAAAAVATIAGELSK
jgi:thioredoxin reductase (NADPH)